MAEAYGPTSDQIDHDYSFGQVSDAQKTAMSITRDSYRELAHEINDTIPNGRAKSLALTKLQESKMWAVQAIVDETRP